jgi:LysR family transcriptional regulator, low CO2-responsive transcriptional regulator
VVIHRDELVVIAAPGHAIAKAAAKSAGKSVTLEEVLRHPLLLPKVGRTRDSIEELCHQRRLKPNVSMELDSSELLKRFVAAGVGIGFIARSTTVADVKAKALAAIPLANAQIKRDLALVFRKDKALSRAALEFIDIAVKTKSAQAAGL